MAEENANEENNEHVMNNEREQLLEREKRVDALLSDKELKELRIQKLVDGGHVAKGTSPNNTDANQASTHQNPVYGNWSAFPTQFPFVLLPTTPFWGPFHASPATTTPPSNPQPTQLPLYGSASSSGQLGSSRPQGQGEEANEEDYVELLDEGESLESVQFDPTVEDENAWDAGEIINSFIEKHFKRAMTMEEREAIMKDFPKPSCPALRTPKIDDDIKKQIKRAGKDPHFGVEKSLYKFQEQILEMAGPLTCLWADLLNQDATVKPEDVILLLQRVLVILGSASHNISQERRRVAWSRTNPATNSLPDISEETKGKETTLFGAGFLERASKRLEEEKALAKVTGSKPAQPPAKRRRQDRDPSDLRRFLESGAPARYGGRNPGRHQPYFQKQPPKFQKRANRNGRK